MIVYGDPSFEADVSQLAARLSRSVRGLRGDINTPPPTTLVGRLRLLDRLRSVLIEAGQLEQATADTPGLPGLEAVTSNLAALFVTYWSELRNAEPLGASQMGPATSRLCAAAVELDRVALPSSCTVTVKVPEGFAFYSLYPEQYIAAVRRWFDHRPEATTDDVLVVGIRSIGTTLSAVVTSALTQQGLRVRRLTVRPTGHPFERRAHLDRLHIAGATCALIVDEGPGLSGSSMAATAEALVEAGIGRDAISFLPGHPHDPGQAASPSVRDWWRSTPRYAVEVNELEWAGRSLQDLMVELTPELVGCDGSVERVEDLSAGAWRGVTYDAQADWPPVCTAFERTKYRCVLDTGRSVLWKFTGFAEGGHEAGGTNDGFGTPLPRANAGWAVAPPAHFHGFLITEWVAGKPLRRDNRSPRLLKQIGRHIAQAARPRMSPTDLRVGRARLEKMLYWNLKERLGEGLAADVRKWSESIEVASRRPPAAYGDGRLAPHEWIRRPDGRIIKVDAVGHTCDHTIVGKQPVWWDLAGAVVEWDLDEAAAETVTNAAVSAGLDRVPSGVLAWYVAAYAALRLGQCTMCAEGAAGDERKRLQDAAEYYLSRIRQLDPPGVVQGQNPRPVVADGHGTHRSK